MYYSGRYGRYVPTNKNWRKLTEDEIRQVEHKKQAFYELAADCCPQPKYINTTHDVREALKQHISKNQPSEATRFLYKEIEVRRSLERLIVEMHRAYYAEFNRTPAWNERDPR